MVLVRFLKNIGAAKRWVLVLFDQQKHILYLHCDNTIEQDLCLKVHVIIIRRDKVENPKPIEFRPKITKNSEHGVWARPKQLINIDQGPESILGKLQKPRKQDTWITSKTQRIAQKQKIELGQKLSKPLKAA